MLCSFQMRNTALISLVFLVHGLLLWGAFHFHLHREIPYSSGVLYVDIHHMHANPMGHSKSSIASEAQKQSRHTDERASSAENYIEKSGGSASHEINAARSALYRPKPHYPLISRRLREQGIVLVQLCINPQGAVHKLDVLQSSGFKNLDNSAINALAEWKFSLASASQGGMLFDCYRVPVQFSLEG